MLVTLFRTNGMPVIHIRHFELDPAVGFLLEGTSDVGIVRVSPRRGRTC